MRCREIIEYMCVNLILVEGKQCRPRPKELGFTTFGVMNFITGSISQFQYEGKYDYQMSLALRKPAFCMRENRDADQLRGDREADQRSCSSHTDCTIPLPPKSETPSIEVSSVGAQPGLCRTRSETLKAGLLAPRLNL